MDRPSSEPKVSYLPGIEDAKKIHTYRFGYHQDGFMQIEFGQLTKGSPEEECITVVGNVLIPKQRLEKFALRLLGYIVYLAKKNELTLNELKFSEQLQEDNE